MLGRESLASSDVIRIVFDSRHDHNTSEVFHVNPAGVLVRHSDRIAEKRDEQVVGSVSRARGVV